jgi:hypothetical protein
VNNSRLEDIMTKYLIGAGALLVILAGCAASKSDPSTTAAVEPEKGLNQEAEYPSGGGNTTVPNGTNAKCASLGLCTFSYNGGWQCCDCYWGCNHVVNSSSTSTSSSSGVVLH